MIVRYKTLEDLDDEGIDPETLKTAVVRGIEFATVPVGTMENDELNVGYGADDAGSVTDG